MTSWEDIISFNEKYFLDWRNVSEVHYSNAMAGEVGEVCDGTKKRVGGGTKGTVISEFFWGLKELLDAFLGMKRMGSD